MIWKHNEGRVFCLGIFAGVTMMAVIVTLVLSIEVPVEKDIKRLQESYDKCLEHNERPYSYNKHNVTCVDGNTYRYTN